MKSKSIIQEDTTCCYVCGHPGAELHHIYHGSANRKKSDKYGCVVGLCKLHHTVSPFGVHFNKNLDDALKRTTQRKFEELYGHDKFMEVFNKNYL